MALKDVPILTPRTCEDVTFHGPRDFAGVFTLRILRWGVILIIWVAAVESRGPYKKEAGGSESEKVMG